MGIFMAYNNYDMGDITMGVNIFRNRRSKHFDPRIHSLSTGYTKAAEQVQAKLKKKPGFWKSVKNIGALLDQDEKTRKWDMVKKLARKFLLGDD